MKNIICMKWGTRYGPQYVNRLFCMVQRHMAGVVGKDYRFICITDDTSQVSEGVECFPIPELNDSLPFHMQNTPWLKLLVWDNPLFDLDGDALFLDLDVVITGRLDDFFAYQPGKFCVIHNWTEPRKKTGNTSVFRFPVGKFPEILNMFKEDMQGTFLRHRIEQRYISAYLEPKGEQVFWPKSWCRSFKEELLPNWPMRFFKPAELPLDARIVVFHGKPDPDEAAKGVWPLGKGDGWKRIYKSIKPSTWIDEHWH